MKKEIVLASIALASTASAFTNLDFESAAVVSNDPTFGFLDWSLAVPGWNHSKGNDTSVVYYGSSHLGTTQAYSLLDTANPQHFTDAPLEGNYSITFRSGDFDLFADPIVYGHAFIAQEGTIPVGTRSLSLLAQGEFQVFFDGNEILMSEGSADLRIGDLTPYQGSTGELKIMESGPEWSGSAVVLDNILFSTTPIPESNNYTLLLSLSIIALIGLNRSNQSK
ncbi:hypothetical protein [Rubellicoccus peritrichatus]|uniref:PEP-CTERM sorting domain-containing protein n=1 Tax=Rubellicoccus peritrichatus TaxID=3080537 RepID=A0AAQ3LFV3_9BACT|nr:hypothetical protein [Puniceicoccus sp. CR14]WOO43075.1 hypothetical protein RZN69_08210 [Puniceicoccus sp. CR14]